MSSDERDDWKPLAFRHAEYVPLPRMPRRDPRAIAMSLLEEVHRGGGFVSPAAFGMVAEAVRLCDAGELQAGLAAANLAAESEPAMRPLALLVARMCVHKQLAAERAALVG